jgi:hypothetical protein
VIGDTGFHGGKAWREKEFEKRYVWQQHVSGRFSLAPPCACGYRSGCAALLFGHIGRAALAADLSALAPHLGHELRREGFGEFWELGFLCWRVPSEPVDGHDTGLEFVFWFVA